VHILVLLHSLYNYIYSLSDDKCDNNELFSKSCVHISSPRLGSLGFHNVATLVDCTYMLQIVFFQLPDGTLNNMQWEWRDTGENGWKPHQNQQTKVKKWTTGTTQNDSHAESVSSSQNYIYLKSVELILIYYSGYSPCNSDTF